MIGVEQVAGARATRLATMVAIAAALGLAPATPSAKVAATRSTASAAKPTPGRALAQRLRAAGRAEARFQREAPDPLGGSRSRIEGRLALELPDRFSLEVPATGERITATSVGGAWLRPDLKQLVRMGPDQAAAVRRAWQMLLGEGHVRAESLGPRHYALTLASAADDPVRVEVTLNAAQLPVRVDYDEGGQRMTYRIRSWRFVPKRGPAAFTLSAPADFDTLRMP